MLSQLEAAAALGEEEAKAGLVRLFLDDEEEEEEEEESEGA